MALDPAEADRPTIVRRSRAAHRSLLHVLLGVDAVMAMLAWAITFSLPLLGPISIVGRLLALGALSASALMLIQAQGLYRSRVCVVRAVEVSRLGRVAVLSALASLAVTAAVAGRASRSTAMAGGALSFALLSGGRGLYAGWLRSRRAKGAFTRPILVVGINDEAVYLAQHLDAHPELGFRVCGFLAGSRCQAAPPGLRALGTIGDVALTAGASGATGAVVVSSALEPDERELVVKELVEARLHVHLSSGLRGIDARRLRWVPMGHEPLFYIEPAASHASMDLAAKRAIDIVGSLAALVVLAPAMATAALAIKLTDKGPVLFRQRRIGRDSRPFTLYKLRSMVPDAEARLEHMTGLNERVGGPLFKLAEDPRVTRVGRILRATSLDEVPQLLNVLRGDMSLVGPRPALPKEVDSFDAGLLIRQQVRPGVSGLWQVEARDNPSFDSYRYLDLFYVENRSLSLDLAILMATGRAVVGGALHGLWASPRRHADTAAAIEPVVLVDSLLVDSLLPVPVSIPLAVENVAG